MSDISIMFRGASDQGDEQDGPFLVDNQARWGHFLRWAGANAAKHPAIAQLAAKGSFTDTAVLSLDLEEALLTKIPDQAARGILETLREHVGDGDEKEEIVVVADDEPDKTDA